MDNWIDVKDKLPNDYDRVVAYFSELDDNNPSQVGEVFYLEGCFIGVYDRDEYPVYVSKWQPMPTP